MKIVKITSLGCPSCIIMNKVINQIKIEYPDIEFLNSIKTCRRIPITQAYLTTPEEGYFRIRKRGEGDKAGYIKDDKEIGRLKGEHKKEELVKIIEENV